jgi:hypothetical protein
MTHIMDKWAATSVQVDCLTSATDYLVAPYHGQVVHMSMQIHVGLTTPIDSCVMDPYHGQVVRNEHATSAFYDNRN